MNFFLFFIFFQISVALGTHLPPPLHTCILGTQTIVNEGYKFRNPSSYFAELVPNVVDHFAEPPNNPINCTSERALQKIMTIGMALFLLTTQNSLIMIDINEILTNIHSLF